MSDVEVEAKFPLDGSAEEWRQRLVVLGALERPPIHQSDEYFAHPARDFGQTGEAFRIRTAGEGNALTYKGPLLDSTTKSRQEIEVGFAAGGLKAQQMRAMLLALSFHSVGCVRKVRTPFEIAFRGRKFELALDEVAELGHFLEIEIAAAETDWTRARDSVLDLAAHLGLKNSERKSYLELLLANHA